MITMGHGAGGRLSHRLIEEHLLPRLANPVLSELGDAAVIGDLALTTDTYVVTPRNFPGGDIGRLAICGTINDLSMVGAIPLGLSAGLILEEGLAIAELDRIVQSMADTAREAGVEVVTGDTKVVPRGACDGVYINTSGVGRIDPQFAPKPGRCTAQDKILVSGTIGDHGMAVMTARESLSIGDTLRSDVAPLNGLVQLLRERDIPVHAMKDPTRGGVGQNLIEIASAAEVRIVIDERALPITPPVRAACELLGIDPLFVANEGKFLASIPTDHAEAALSCVRTHPLGRNAALIGEVQTGEPGLVLTTALGGQRRVRMPVGELLPRIC